MAEDKKEGLNLKTRADLEQFLTDLSDQMKETKTIVDGLGQNGQGEGEGDKGKGEGEGDKGEGEEPSEEDIDEVEQLLNNE